MKEQEQLSKNFNDLFDGKPWIDVTLLHTLEEITAKEAATKPFPSFNSIWEIVNHMIHWRETVLRRMHGETVESPDDNYFFPVRDRSEKAWHHTIEQLHTSQHQWLAVIKKMKRKDLEAIPEANLFSKHELIHGILQHDSYHLGQIRLIKKLVRSI